MTARLLIVDDHPGYRLLVRTALTGSPDVEVVGEHTTAHGACVAARRAGADIALIDMLLPDGDGFGVASELQRAMPSCVPILTSAYPEADLEAFQFAPSAVGMLPKSAPAARLAAEITVITAALRGADSVAPSLVTELPADRGSARTARRVVSSALADWGIPETAEVVELLVTELVTNAIVHGGSGVDLGIRIVGGRLRVDVVDRSTSWLKRRTADDDAASGRGTDMVEALAAAWGVEARPGGKSVWFEIDLPDGAP